MARNRQYRETIASIETAKSQGEITTADAINLKIQAEMARDTGAAADAAQWQASQAYQANIRAAGGGDR